MADKIFCSYSDGIMFCNHVLRDVSENAMYGPHSHNVYEMIYVKSGVARYGVQGKEYPIGEGDLLITKPYEEHYLYPDAGVRYERYDVLFDENALGFREGGIDRFTRDKTLRAFHNHAFADEGRQICMIDGCTAVNEMQGCICMGARVQTGGQLCHVAGIPLADSRYQLKLRLGVTGIDGTVQQIS